MRGEAADRAPRAWAETVGARRRWQRLVEWVQQPRVKRVLLAAFLLVVLGLLADHARGIDWPAVWASMRRSPPQVLLQAAAIAALAHLVYSSFDLIGRWHSGHALPVARVAGVGFASYAFNINLGSLVGGIALRYRLYARFGLDLGTVTDIVALSMLTNWLGYMAVAGVVFLWRPLALPPDWNLDSDGLRLLGAALLAVVTAYGLACRLATKRVWRVRGRALALPSGRMAAVQFAIASTNWLLIAAVVWTALQGRIDYPTVLSVLLIAAVAGLVTHVPAGLGVIEAVFVALLSHRLPSTELLGALLVYRAIYYIVPLCLAAPLALWLDARATHVGGQPAPRQASGLPKTRD